MIKQNVGAKVGRYYFIHDPSKYGILIVICLVCTVNFEIVQIMKQCVILFVVCVPFAKTGQDKTV
jgi:hypothetical protein